MIYEIKNKTLTAKINSHGAELLSVKQTNGCEFIWQGDEKYWSEHAPVLFPFCGRNLDGCYKYGDKKYSVLIHGFAKSNEFSLLSKEDNTVVLKFVSNEETLKIYPFNFEFYVTYSLKENKLTIEYLVKNTNEKEMIFAYGFHPGFNVPINNVGNFEDYYLEFSKDTYPKRKLINNLDAHEDEIVEFKNKKIELTHDLFSDCHFFKSVNDVVTLRNKLNNDYIEVSYSNMTSLGLWKKEYSDAPYICIEPCYGFPGSFDKYDSLETRKEMIHLESGKEFKNSITIKFFAE